MSNPPAKKEADGGDVLAAFFKEVDSYAVYFLKQQGIERLDILKSISHGSNAKKEEDHPEAQEEEPQDSSQEEVRPAKSSKKGQLETYTDNLTERAEAGRIDPLIGRDIELQR